MINTKLVLNNGINKKAKYKYNNDQIILKKLFIINYLLIIHQSSHFI